MVRPDLTFIFEFQTAFVGNKVLNSKIKVNSGLNKITITLFLRILAFSVPKLMRNTLRIQWEGSQGLKYARNAIFCRKSFKNDVRGRNFEFLSSYSTVFGILSGKFDRIAFRMQWNRPQGPKNGKKSLKVCLKNPRMMVSTDLSSISLASA